MKTVTFCASFMEDSLLLVHAENKIFTTSVHIKIGIGTSYWHKDQDYESIANAGCDFMIRTYDLHWAISLIYNNLQPSAGCQ